MNRKIETFFRAILKRNEYIIAEADSIKGINYFPESIWQLIRTDPVKRMARIFQTGTNIYTFHNMNHTRLEHSKGTYYRTLEVLQQIYQDKNVKEIIEKRQYQKYMIAELIRALLHDIGHGPFSHTMETVCNLPKGFHEDMGERIIKENVQIRDALEKIHPDLPELIKEVKDNNFLGLNRLFEGQIDLDRGDFLPRDDFFIRRNYDEVSKVVEELLSNFSIKKMQNKEGRSFLAPVFDANQIQNVETFLEERFYNYRNVYYYSKCVSYEYIFKKFAEKLVKCDEEHKLKEFLEHNMNKRPEEVDLEEYISFNDVEYLKGIIEVIKTTKDEGLRNLAVLSLPSEEMIESIYYGLMVSEEQTEDDGRKVVLSETDKEFLKDLISLKNPESELGSLARTYKIEDNCIVLNTERQEQRAEIIEKIKRRLGIQEEDLEELGFISWSNKIISYKKKNGEEIYIKSDDGKIYEYSEHPQRKSEILETTQEGFCLLVPLLLEKGYTESQVQQAISIIEEFNNRILKESKEQADLTKEDLEEYIVEEY